MTLEAKLKEIKDRCDAATEGPWIFYPEDETDHWQLSDYQYTFFKQDDSGVPITKPEGDFIAHARTDVPMLLEMVEKFMDIVDWYVPDQKEFQRASKEIEKIAEKYK